MHRVGRDVDDIARVQGSEVARLLEQVDDRAIGNGAPATAPFVSSNRWDVMGATAFGFRCAWVNRADLPDAPVLMVERTIRDWPLRYGSYDLDGLSVWGATARILSQLGAVLADPAR